MPAPDVRGRSIVSVKRLLRATAIAALLILLLALLILPGLGRFLVVEHPLTKADAIFVLGGSRLERPLEALDLYHDGWAPQILLSSQEADGGERALRARGIPVMSEPEFQKATLVSLGVPENAISILRDDQPSTADEAVALAATARERHWSRVIVVTSKMHTRRAELAMGRRAARMGVTIQVHGSRYDGMDVDHWWRRRGDLRFVLFEVQKLALYWTGIAD